MAIPAATPGVLTPDLPTPDLPTESADPAAPLEPSAHHEQADTTDPRIRRTRQLLQQALVQLLRTREFDKLSVQEITDAAGVNRATFYAHYPDKFALLECVVASRFHSLLAERGVVFDGTCGNAIYGIILGVCDFLNQTATQLADTPCGVTGQLPPHMESAVIAVVRNMLFDGTTRNPPTNGDSPALIAATASWAIYGAAREWLQTPNHPPSEQIAPTIQRLITPLLHPTEAHSG